ncbi:hypothetical protein CY34DRAFT_18649 [Suillus luteus UH-Slu-Lm8-n1]|uniref:Uncharacterized protein n=1 Tax=Suillus luteus UH-Slu-Lm8-n1 TaxID=930992 RepID=A0A0C9Z6E1_9AGAM|nr:hypothetical protein CY34DRAFT_18649 [Suillus luteus UH-Slu-Lm8-n1]
MPTAEVFNAAMGEAAEQLLTIVEKGANLRDGHPGHLKLAIEIADLLSTEFNAHGMTATLIPPGLLSAAMEMQEHLDVAQQSFTSAPVWASIRDNDPQIQHHPMKEKAQIITVARPQHQQTAATNESTGNANNAAAPAPAPAKAKANAQAKGKGKEVVSAENEGVVNRGAAPPQVGETAIIQTKTTKCPKVVPESVTNDVPKVISPKENSKLYLDGSELDPPCNGCIKVSAICREGFGVTGATLKACGWCAWQKLRCTLAKAGPGEQGRTRSQSRHRPQAEDMVVDDDDIPNATNTALPPLHATSLSPTTSVPPIATLDSETAPPAQQSESSMLDPPHGQQTMDLDLDESGDGLTKVLEGMTLEVMQDSVDLTAQNAALWDHTTNLQMTITVLHAENVAAAAQLKALQARITAQDVALHELQGLRVEVVVLHDEVKMLRGESSTRDQQLRCAQDQLGQQERMTAALQDTYNAIRQCLTSQPHSLSSPFTNSLYLANPMYGTGQPMVPLSMGQMQNMEGLYLNLPSSVANISNGSMLGAPAAGPSANAITGSSRTGGDTISGAVPGSR